MGKSKKPKRKMMKLTPMEAATVLSLRDLMAHGHFDIDKEFVSLALVMASMDPAWIKKGRESGGTVFRVRYTAMCDAPNGTLMEGLTYSGLHQGMAEARKYVGETAKGIMEANGINTDMLERLDVANDSDPSEAEAVLESAIAKDDGRIQ